MNASPALPASRGEAVNGLVEENLPLVGHLVRELLGKVPLHVSRDDLTPAGIMAGVVAAQGYQPERGVPFARYASIRIRGALLDELRSMDWAARSVRTQAREMDNVQHQLAAAPGPPPATGDGPRAAPAGGGPRPRPEPERGRDGAGRLGHRSRVVAVRRRPRPDPQPPGIRAGERSGADRRDYGGPGGAAGSARAAPVPGTVPPPPPRAGGHCR